MADSTGNIVNTYEYDPWGNIRSQTEAVDNPIKYAGEYYDDELGMYYLRARYYDPAVGRFISRDIKEGDISSPLDMNRYVYCRNNPVKYVDPSGESFTITYAVLGLLSLIVLTTVTVGEIYNVNHLVNNIEENRKHHILHGTNNSHENGWRKFGIDPNDPNGFENLIPIINEVIKNGTRGEWKDVGNGRYVQEIVCYFSKVGETVKVIINKTAEGIEKITYAFTIFK